MNDNILYKNLIRLAIFILSLTAFTMWFNEVTAQNIYLVDSPYKADIVCSITNNRFEADWVIYQTDNKYDTGNGKWFITENRFEADYRIYIAENPFIATHKIFYTRNKFITNCNLK